MASVFGITLKKIKNNYGHDGAGYASADVYLNGKKLGAWWQDAWCGPDHYEFDSHLLDGALDQYKASGRIEASAHISLEKMLEIYNVDCLLGTLCDLTEMEKKYKQAVKKGFTTLVMSEFGEGFMSIQDKDAVVNSDLYKSLVERSKGGKINVYTSLDDFKVA